MFNVNLMQMLFTDVVFLDTAFYILRDKSAERIQSLFDVCLCYSGCNNSLSCKIIEGDATYTVRRNGRQVLSVASRVFIGRGRIVG